MVERSGSLNYLNCQNLNFFWDANTQNRVQAVKELSFEAKDGQLIAILGPSGCGKSTLLQLICGLEKPGNGEIIINDKKVEGPSSDRGIVFQESCLFPWLSVLKNVEFGLKMKSNEKTLHKNLALDVLKSVGLENWDKHYPHQLSGGMKQRVAIARTLVNKPSILLMDEPFASLDFQTRILMQEFLLKVWESFNPIIIMTTHVVDEAISLADKILVFSSRPATILKNIEIDSPRPRDIFSEKFNHIRQEITEILSTEVLKSIK